MGDNKGLTVVEKYISGLSKDSVEYLGRQIERRSLAHWAQGYLMRPKWLVDKIEAAKRQTQIDRIAKSNEELEVESRKEPLPENIVQLIPRMKENKGHIERVIEYIRGRVSACSGFSLKKITLTCQREETPYNCIGRGPGGRGVYWHEPDYKLQCFIHFNVEGRSFGGDGEDGDWFCLSFTQSHNWYADITFGSPKEALKCMFSRLNPDAKGAFLELAGVGGVDEIDM